MATTTTRKQTTPILHETEEITWAYPLQMETKFLNETSLNNNTEYNKKEDELVRYSSRINTEKLIL